jgi:Domain of unknown function (DUF3846)
VTDSWKGYVTLQAFPPAMETHPWTAFEGEPEPLRVIQNAVGGYIEMVRTCIPGIHMYCNEEGKLRDLPGNRLATSLLSPYHRDIIVGDVILLRDGVAGDEAPLDAVDLRMIRQALGVPDAS